MTTARRDDRDDGVDTPELTSVAAVGGATGCCLVWRFERARPVVSSAIVGGGAGDVRWILNLSVDSDYSRLDPTDHLRAVARELRLAGRGVAMMTAVPVDRHHRVAVEGVHVCATVGVATPVWAADISSGRIDHCAAAEARPGTINLVVEVPARVDDGAMVNLVTTVTEAKTQALLAAGVAGTGTATDVVCVVGDHAGEVAAFGGPRSPWGRRAALATHRVVSSGLTDTAPR